MRSFREPSLRWAVSLIVLITVTTVLVGGLVVWLLDPRDFPTLGLAWWWSLQTATTVGYGDIVPRGPAAKAVGAALMVLSTAFLTTVTAAVTSAFVDHRRRLRDREADPAATLAQIVERLERIESQLRNPGAPDHGAP